MLKKRPIKNAGYGFVTVIFLVIALSCLALFAFLNQRDTDKLTQTVNDLSTTRSSMENVDKAIQLLYAAENNSRMYILYKDSNFAFQYKKQLQEVSYILNEVEKEYQNTDDKQNFRSLVKNKSERTALYIQARVLMDSILSQKSLPELAPKEKSFISRLKIAPYQNNSRDTQRRTNVVEVKSKKKLFKRLKDAIVNKTDKNVSDNVVIRQQERDSIYLLKEKELIRHANLVNDQAKYFQQLKEREKSLLTANHKLLEGLQSILTSLRNDIDKSQQERKSILSANAFSLTHNLKISNTLLIVFGLLLTLIILYILQRLFKNSQSLKQAKDEAEEYARLKSEFAETMSHEIRTPLHSITRFANELSGDQRIGNQPEVIDAIKLSSRMLLSVVNNILDYTKMEKGKFKLAAIPFNPNGVIHEIMMGLMLQAKRKRIDLVENLDSSLDIILIGDSFQLRQLLINILSNAIKYTDEGSITVDAILIKKSKEQMVLELAVKDTGIGIDNRHSEALFDAYATAVHRKEIQEGSTGLGLSIVKKVVELHKGSIRVQSVVGKGTTFFIALPYKLGTSIMQTEHQLGVMQTKGMAEAADNPRGKEVDDVTETDDMPSLNILIVDNDLLNLKYLTMLLKRKNHTTIEVQNGKTAMELFEQHQYDLVITDISMPGMSGYDLANAVRKDKDVDRANTPIIAISGFDDGRKDHGEEKDSRLFNGWLLKPYSPDELFNMIKEVIRLRK